MLKLYGKNNIKERLKSRPRTIKRIYFKQDVDNINIKELAIKKNIPCVFLTADKFSKVVNYNHAQGIAADIQEFSYAKLDDILNFPDDKKFTLIALSNVTDPQNLGSILRTAACFGNFALIIPRHRSASVNETVLKVACGGENYVPVVQETNLIPVLEKAKKAGYWTVGTMPAGGDDMAKFKFSFPLCLVVGSEDKGIRHGIMPHLDFKITLAMPGKSLSLNVAVATAVFCYEITRQYLAAKG
jgi:23S rRNA (guanosine2251-2'-O)-methyltransferase